MKQRLARVGLVEAGPACPSLGAFLAAYLDYRKPTVKPGTLANLTVAANKLLEHFGAEVRLTDIGPREAVGFATFLGQTQAAMTAARLLRRARQFLGAAVQQRLIPENPFVGVKAGSNKPDKARQAFVPREVIERVIEACPDTEWRLIVALSRYAGLRCPTEHLALTWADVNWERHRFRVDSPKTGERWVPIFPELRPYLEAAFEEAPVGTVHVIRRYRTTNVNLRTQLTRIIRRAGLSPWPKLFHNLRASCQTELVERFPVHLVCSWLGNSTLVAQKHYLQVRDADFERAVKAPQDPTGQLPESSGTVANPGTGGLSEMPCFPVNSTTCHSVYKRADPREEHSS